MSAAAGVGTTGTDPHDESVTASLPPHPGLSLPALRRLTWWVTVACLLVIAGLVIGEVATGRPGDGAARSAVVVPAVTGVCVAAGVLFASSLLGRPVLSGAQWRSSVLLAVLVAAGLLVLSRGVGQGAFPWPLPLAAALAAAHTGSPNPWRAVWPAGLGLALLASLCGSWWGGAVTLSGAVQDAAIVAIAAWGLLAQVWMLRVVDHLDRARRLESAAAVTGERLRFAAELHDIQGHNLQVIALKSELAERLAGVDPERAVAEMREVQELARQALGDTRAVVQGYRRVTLETELANAARVLTAAGIDCRIERGAAASGAAASGAAGCGAAASGAGVSGAALSGAAASSSAASAAGVSGGGMSGLPETAATLVGLVVREGTTNVLRHSSARHCVIELTAEAGVLHLVMCNDAPFGEHPGPAGGLAALADRLASAGGTLAWHLTSGEFAIEATLPTAAPGPAVAGPAVAGPALAGPAVAGPAAPGPAAAGPVTAGFAATGAMRVGPARDGADPRAPAPELSVGPRLTAPPEAGRGAAEAGREARR